MASTLNAPLPALVFGLIIGIFCLALIANELGKQANLPPPARLLLSGALGLGVLSVGIKVLIVAALSLSNSQALAATGTAARAAMADWLPPADTPVKTDSVRPLPRTRAPGAPCRTPRQSRVTTAPHRPRSTWGAGCFTIQTCRLIAACPVPPVMCLTTVGRTTCAILSATGNRSAIAMRRPF